MGGPLGPIEQRGNPDIADLQGLDDVPVVAGATNILAPTDLTVESRNVVNYAAILAKSCGAHLTVLHVYREPYNAAYLRGSPAYASIERHRHDTKSVLESFAEEVRERYADCSTEFRTGIPCEEIIQAAKDLQIDMLVISTHGHKWFRRSRMVAMQKSRPSRAMPGVARARGRCALDGS
jgi:universal stress protein A